MSRHIEPLGDTPEKLIARVQGRMAAKDVWELLEERTSDKGFMESLIHELQRQAGLLPPATEQEQHEPIARLGLNTVPFGKFKGETFDDTDRSYLDWLCSELEMFLKDLRAYLKHPDLESHRGEYDDGLSDV